MSELQWRAYRQDDERAITDYIRKHGYIGQETLGDICPTWRGVGDGGGYFDIRSRDYERIRAANQLRRQKPPKPKYEPMF